MVVGPIARGIDSNINRHPRTGQKHVEKVAHSNRASGADVVYAPRLSALHDATVGSDGIADIGEVALRIQVSDRDLRFPLSRFDVSDTARKTRRDEPGVLPRAEVVE